MPMVTGPIGRGNLQYAAMWKAAQRFTEKPVKFGGASAEIICFSVQDRHYNSVPDRMRAIAEALNQEYHELADAGCPVIQIEEPQLHLILARGISGGEINAKLLIEVFNRTVKGLRAKTEVWAHSCWGNPSQQRMFAQVQSYRNALEAFNELDADVITFETSSSGGADLEATGKIISKDRKISIGVIDHHTLQVETPEEVADADPPRAGAHSRRAADDLDRLRHGPRGHEPPPRLLQVRVAGARHQYRAQGARRAGGQGAGRRRALFAGGAARALGCPGRVQRADPDVRTVAKPVPGLQRTTSCCAAPGTPQRCRHRTCTPASCSNASAAARHRRPDRRRQVRHHVPVAGAADARPACRRCRRSQRRARAKASSRPPAGRPSRSRRPRSAMR